MKGEAMLDKSHDQAELRDFGPFMESVRKSLSGLINSLAKKSRAGGTQAAVDDIKRVMHEIETMQRNQQHMLALVVKDDYVARAMESIVPKLPALIERKRKELQESDIERFLELVMPADPLKDVMLDIENDNVRLRERFVREHPCLDSKAVNKNAGHSSANEAQTAWRWKSKGQIFSIDYFGKELFPAFQFEDGKPLPIIKKILEIFGNELSAWQIAFWFIAENGWLDGKRPIDFLKKSDEGVVGAAKRELERAYH